MPAKILTRGTQWPLRMGADLVVEGDGLEDVEELALVFVDALDVDVEQRIGIDRDADAVADQSGELHLVGPLDGGETPLEGRIVGQRR